MAAIAYNLKKLMKWQPKKAQADIKALQNELQYALLILTGIIKRYYRMI